MTKAGLLLDSNIMVWLDQKPDRLSASVIQRLESNEQVFVSAATAWELGIKVALGKLTLIQPISKRIGNLAFTELPVSIQHGEAAAQLPPYHRDPFDRLLVAQAKVESLVLVTGDRRLMNYGIAVMLV